MIVDTGKTTEHVDPLSVLQSETVASPEPTPVVTNDPMSTFHENHGTEAPKELSADINTHEEEAKIPDWLKPQSTESVTPTISIEDIAPTISEDTHTEVTSTEDIQEQSNIEPATALLEIPETPMVDTHDGDIPDWLR